MALARRWPLEYWDRPPGIPSLVGFEPYHLVRPFFRPEAFPYARFDISGVDHIPAEGPVAAGLQPPELLRRGRPGVVAARLGRPVRFLAKQEVFDAPVVGRLARALGGHRGGAGQRLVRAHAPGRGRPAGRRGGHRAPPGDHPPWRGVLRPGAARADRHGPSGRRDRGAGGPGRRCGGPSGSGPGRRRFPTDHLPTRPGHRHRGAAGALGLEDAVADTAGLMAAIADLLPEEARVRHVPTARGLASYPTLGVTVRRHAPPPALPAARLGRRRGAAAINWLSRSARSGQRDGGRRPGRAGRRPRPAGHPGRRSAGGPGHRDQREDDHHTAAGGRAHRPGDAAGGHQRHRGQHAGRPRGRPGRRPTGAAAVLEVDEGYLGRLIAETRPEVVVLLNLSRDQLDRIAEVRMLVDRWRGALGRLAAEPAPSWWPTPTTPWWCGRPRPPPGAVGRRRSGLAPRCRGMPGLRGRIAFDAAGVGL